MFVGKTSPQWHTVLASAQRSLGSVVACNQLCQGIVFAYPVLDSYLLSVELNSVLGRSWASAIQPRLLTLVVLCWMAQVLVAELDQTGTEGTASLVGSCALL